MKIQARKIQSGKSWRGWNVQFKMSALCRRASNHSQTNRRLLTGEKLDRLIAEMRGVIKGGDIKIKFVLAFAAKASQRIPVWSRLRARFRISNFRAEI